MIKSLLCSLFTLLSCGLLLGQTPDSSFNPNVDGEVTTLAVQADGKILMGGFFSSVGGVTRDNIARFNADGSLDSTFNPDADERVYSLAVQADGKILMGGYFNNVGGVARNGIARLNADGTLDASFNPNANSEVTTLAVQADGKILMGGSFTTVGGVTRDNIARLNADGSLDASFNPNTNSDGISLAVQADGKILMAGLFTSVGGVARNNIARLNADGTLDASFNPNADEELTSLNVQADGKILMGGYFTGVGGVARNGIARLNVDGSLDSTFNPNASGSVSSLAVQADGKILMAGYFTTVGGVTRNGIARLNADGSLDVSFNPIADEGAISLAVQADGKILMGGYFTTVGGVACNSIARLTNDTEAISTLTVSGITQIDWTRGGSAPELEQVTFENWNGSVWVSLGGATRVSGGWRMTGLSLSTSGQIRARGRSSGSQRNGSSGIIEQIVTYSPPDIALEAPIGTAVSTGNGTLDFGQVVPGQIRDLVCNLRNTGGVELTDIMSTFTGTDSSLFTLVSSPPSFLAPGASANFTVRFSPTSSGAKGATLSIASNDPDESPYMVNLTGTGASSVINFNGWSAASGLVGAAAAPDATPFNDGVPNLLKYAFNMNAGGPDVSVLAPGGSSGLPQVSLDESGTEPVLRVEFLRRKGSGLIYTPQRSTTLDGFVPMTGTQTVTPINDQWERVTFVETAPPATTSSSFARVEVRLP